MFRKKIAIDFGTENTIVYIEGVGVVVEEKTAIAISKKNNKIIAIGNEAYSMLNRVGGDIIASKPIKHGAIADFKLAQNFLKFCINRSVKSVNVFKPIVMVAAPYGISSVEERALKESVKNAGAGQVYLMPSSIAAAIGSGVLINQSSGNLIITLGGGAIEISVISVNSIVVSKTIKISSEDVNSKISLYLRRKYGILVGDPLSELIKREIGSLVELNKPLRMQVRARDANLGDPKVIDLDSNELVEIFEGTFEPLISGIKDIISKTPPELASDILDRGMILTGGGALLRGIDEFIVRKTQIPAHIVDNPKQSVILGLIEGLKNIDLISRALK